jgi:quercetin dioxygenase-like cupin family protein
MAAAGPAIRRVVTTHDAQGKAIVMIDEVAQGDGTTQIWQTDAVPVDNNDQTDPGQLPGGRRTIPTGCALRYADYPPHYKSAMHSTQTLDYAFVIDGLMDMELDDGVVVNLKTGDVVVQRGTNHRWMNNSDRPCRMAFVMIPAAPVMIDGKPKQASMT